jgi:hypothetical protein
MSVGARDADKVLTSVARYIACLEPKWGNSYYFERYGKEVAEKLEKLRCSTAVTHFGRRIYVCPFCGKKMATPGAMVTHIIYRHKEDVLELLER